MLIFKKVIWRQQMHENYPEYKALRVEYGWNYKNESS